MVGDHDRRALGSRHLGKIVANETRVAHFERVAQRAATYDAIRTASGVLGFAEPMLGSGIADQPPVDAPGASWVERNVVVGAWEVPAAMDVDALTDALRTIGTAARTRVYRDGQIATIDFTARGGARLRLRLLMIDGAHPRLETEQALALRPAKKRYLIAYRLR